MHVFFVACALFTNARSFLADISLNMTGAHLYHPSFLPLSHNFTTIIWLLYTFILTQFDMHTCLQPYAAS